jgi:RNA polymerase sigma-70 factor, ECF subfamily
MTRTTPDNTALDSECIARIRNSGSTDAHTAFGELYDRYSNRVYLYVRRILLDHTELIDDVFQNTFVKFYEQITAGTEIQNVAGYLLRTARNLAFNEMTSRRRLAFLDNDELPTSNDQHTNNDLHSLLEHAMQKLPDDYRECVVLREQMGLDYDEIVTITGLSHVAVRQRVSRGKAMLRAILTPLLEE